MHVLIGYESMYGTTHRIAEAIATGFSPDDEVRVLAISEINDSLRWADLLVVGIPTHVHRMPWPTSRRAALQDADTRFDHHEVDPQARVDFGAREWLETLSGGLDLPVATFDTRFHAPGWLVGHPARELGRALRKRGAARLASPKSFFVGQHEVLRAGELDRAQEWGRRLRSLAVHSGRRASAT